MAHGRVMHHILSVGSVGALACYIILKKNSKHARYTSYTAKNGKHVSGYNLLRKETGMSLSVLKDKVPALIRMGLCDFNEDGDLVMLGGRKLNKRYYTREKVEQVFSHTKKKTTKWKQRKVKLVAVDASSYKNAKEFLQVLLLHSSLRSQQKEGGLKKERIDRFNSYQEDTKGGSIKEWKSLKKMREKNPELFLGYRSDLCLSLKGTAKAISATTTNSESLGSYYRQKLKKKGLISTQRKYKMVEGFERRVFKQEHLQQAIIEYKHLYNAKSGVGLRIMNGKLCIEIASKLRINVELPKK